MSSAIHKKANKHAMEIKAKLLTAESQLLAAESKVREFHADALCLGSAQVRRGVRNQVVEPRRGHLYTFVGNS